ncbi:MAG TPA: oligoendopeptidase F [Caldimonas sp.]|nr:oligoendopeptidase F [Caldimonas sp.]
MNKPLTRAEVAIETTWNLADLFATRDAWLAELAAVERSVETVVRHQGRLGDGPGELLACLEARDALLARLDRVGAYAGLREAEDGGNAAHQADLSTAAALGARVDAAVKFVDTEILALPDGTIAAYLCDEPALAVYRPTLDELAALKPHMLSPETERMLASLGEVLDAPHTIYSRAKTGDMAFAPFTDAAGATHPNSFNLYQSTYEADDDTSVRRGAWASFCAGLAAHQHTLGGTFATEVAKNIVLAKARGHESAERFLLHAHKVPFELYTNVLDIIQAELAPHMRRYARLRRRVLGLDRLLFCDIKAPLDPGYAPAMTFEATGALLEEALAPLGAEYVGFVRSAFANRWIDRASNVGKSSGAFCATPYGVHSFILMTWADSMRDAFTLAHELGHAGHFMLAGKHQRRANTDVAMPFVEAPSIMNEVLLARHLLARSPEPRVRRWLLTQVLGTYHHNFVTHLLEAELQRQVYRLAEGGQPVTAALLNERKRAILQAFWGDDVEIDAGAAMTWMRQPHYYLGLYPYTYSVGLVAATALGEKSSREGPGVLAHWLDVLRAGGSLPPLELMRRVGIDLSSPQPIHDAVAYAGRLIDELEASH